MSVIQIPESPTWIVVDENAVRNAKFAEVSSEANLNVIAASALPARPGRLCITHERVIEVLSFGCQTCAAGSFASMTLQLSLVCDVRS